MTYYSDYVQQLQTLFKSLTDQTSVDWVRIEYEDILKEGTPAACVELVNFLSEAFEKEPNTLQQNPELNTFYEKIWHDMAFRGFIAFSEKEKLALLEQRVVSALKSGVDIEIFLQNYFDAFPEFPEDAKQALSHFANPLAQNTETIGTAPIEIGGKKYFPQVKFWLQDYLNSPSVNAKRGSIDRLNYINRSPNVRSLTQIQRQQLLAVLKLYDDLLNPPQELAAAHNDQDNQPVPTSLSPVRPVISSEVSSSSINIDQRLEDLKHRVEEK